ALCEANGVDEVMGERGTAAGRIGITFMYRGTYIEYIVTQRAQIKTLFHWNSDGMLPQCFASMRIKDLQRIWPLAGEYIQMTLGSLYLGGTRSRGIAGRHPQCYLPEQCTGLCIERLQAICFLHKSHDQNALPSIYHLTA